jgi:hypothetical protein
MPEDSGRGQAKSAVSAGVALVLACGGDWISAAEAERMTCALAMRQSSARPRRTEAEIKAIVDKLADLARSSARPRP